MKDEEWFLLRVMESECCPETSTELNLSCSQIKPCLDSVRELEHLVEMGGGSAVCAANLLGLQYMCKGGAKQTTAVVPTFA